LQFWFLAVTKKYRLSDLFCAEVMLTASLQMKAWPAHCCRGHADFKWNFFSSGFVLKRLRHSAQSNKGRCSPGVDMTNRSLTKLGGAAAARFHCRCCIHTCFSTVTRCNQHFECRFAVACRFTGSGDRWNPSIDHGFVARLGTTTITNTLTCS